MKTKIEVAAFFSLCAVTGFAAGFFRVPLWLPFVICLGLGAALGVRWIMRDLDRFLSQQEGRISQQAKERLLRELRRKRRLRRETA